MWIVARGGYGVKHVSFPTQWAIPIRCVCVSRKRFRREGETDDGVGGVSPQEYRVHRRRTEIQ